MNPRTLTLWALQAVADPRTRPFTSAPQPRLAAAQLTAALRA
ncbi:hypothetical protein [Demequina sp.]